jgi:CPA1 family monovalent cation:H+ antiporter
VVQGTTLARLARLLGLRADDEQTEREEAHARHAVARVGLRRLEDLLDQADVPQPVVDQLRRGLEQRVDRTRVRVETGQAAVGEGTAMSYRALRRQLLVAERAELVRLRDVGEVSDEVLRKVQRSLDIEEAGL